MLLAQLEEFCHLLAYPVALRYRAQNRAVLARRLVLGLDEFAVEINIDVGALDYIVHVLAEHVVLPSLGDDAVEVVVRGEEGVHVARVVGGVAVAHEAVEPFERALVHAGAAGELDAHILKILADGIGIVHLVRMVWFMENSSFKQIK